MRTIRIKLYKFSELSKDAQDKVVMDQANFESGEFFNPDGWVAPIADELAKMQTPWFLAETLYHKYRDQLIETIEANDYEFTKDGKLN